MGFVTTINPATGREVYCCDYRWDGCSDYPATAHRCPDGYCQRYYLCKNCWDSIKKSGKWKDIHKSCHDSANKYLAREQEKKMLQDAGKFVRVAALSHSDSNKCEVIFRCHDKEITYYMNTEVYRSIPLLSNATPEDYAMKGSIIPAEKEVI